MNRRDFLKGAIILPNLFSLLPVLARAPQPLAAPLFVELPPAGLVILKRIMHRWVYAHVAWTRVYYEGTLDRLRELHELAAKSESVLELYFSPDCEEMMGDSGFSEGWIAEDWGKLGVVLSGCWMANPGIVKRGESGVVSFDS